MPHLYAADIGGTHARFARFALAKGEPELELARWGRTEDMRHTGDLLTAMRSLLGSVPAPGDSLAVAVAGPAAGLRGTLTHAPLVVDLSDAAGLRGLNHCLVCNDFAAQAFATLTLPGQHARLLRPGAAAPATATRAVLGGGTGLGAAALIWAAGPEAGCWTALSSEAGHTAFPFAGDTELRCQAFLAQALGRDIPAAEDVLSGRGLALLHRFLTGRNETPEQIGATALDHETETLQWYARFLGRFCRQWMCATLCLGGLWIAGGIAAKNPRCVTHPAFLEELGRSSALAHVLDRIPVRLIDDMNSGLWGAARALLPCKTLP